MQDANAHPGANKRNSKRILTERNASKRYFACITRFIRTIICTVLRPFVLVLSHGLSLARGIALGHPMGTA